MEFPILVLKHTVERFDIEMLFIIIKESSLVSPPTLEAECWLAKRLLPEGTY